MNPLQYIDKVVRYQYIYELLVSRTKDLESIRHEERRLESELDILRPLAVFLGEGICKDCNGYGETRVFLTQDESKMEICTLCKGTGQVK